MPEPEPITISQQDQVEVIRLGIHHKELDLWILTGTKILMDSSGTPLIHIRGRYPYAMQTQLDAEDQTLPEGTIAQAKTTILAVPNPSEEILKQIGAGELDLGIVAPEVMRRSNERGFYVGELAFPGLSHTTTVRAALVSSTPVNPLVTESHNYTLDLAMDRFMKKLLKESQRNINEAYKLKLSTQN